MSNGWRGCRCMSGRSRSGRRTRHCWCMSGGVRHRGRCSRCVGRRWRIVTVNPNVASSPVARVIHCIGIYFIPGHIQGVNIQIGAKWRRGIHQYRDNLAVNPIPTAKNYPVNPRTVCGRHLKLNNPVLLRLVGKELSACRVRP
jgi:hypothetical protein